MRFDCHYDKDADIAWVRLEGYAASRAVAKETLTGLREVDPATGAVVGLEFWEASKRLPADLLDALPPPVEVAA